MAKITTFFFCILFISACNYFDLSKADLESYTDSAKADIPVQVDTTFADTARTNLEIIPADTIPCGCDSVTVSIIETIQEVKPDTPKYLKLKQVYTGYIGVTELTGNNDGPWVKKFMASVGLGEGYAWCAGFVKYCMQEAGYVSVSVMNGMALSTENKSNIIFKLGKFNKEPRPGDIMTLYYPSLKRIGHTGFYDQRINDKIFETVEGNTTGPNGDGVYRKKRSFNATYSISRWD